MSKMTTNSSLPFEDQMPVFKDVAELAKLCALDRDQYLLYMDAVDRYRASVAVYNEQYEKGMTDGLADGMAKGMAKGMAEGMEKGAKEEKLKNAKAMKNLGVDAATIAKGFGLSLQEIDKL